jgi:hypothetical protein
MAIDWQYLKGILQLGNEVAQTKSPLAYTSFLSRLQYSFPDNDKDQLLFSLSYSALNSHILVADSSEILEYKLVVQSRTIRHGTLIAEM